MSDSIWPTEIRLSKDKRTLSVAFEDGAAFTIPAELLRVRSPSAEVQGHGPGQRQTVPGKRDVMILEVAPVGSYAVRLRFDDMHGHRISRGPSSTTWAPARTRSSRNTRQNSRRRASAVIASAAADPAGESRAAVQIYPIWHGGDGDPVGREADLSRRCPRSCRRWCRCPARWWRRT